MNVVIFFWLKTVRSFSTAKGPHYFFGKMCFYILYVWIFSISLTNKMLVLNNLALICFGSVSVMQWKLHMIRPDIMLLLPVIYIYIYGMLPPNCSKLTPLLANDETYIKVSNIHVNADNFAEKMWIPFAVQGLLTIFSKNITTIKFINAVNFTESSTNNSSS